MKRFKAFRARLGCFCYGHDFELIQPLPKGNEWLLGCSRCGSVFYAPAVGTVRKVGTEEKAKLINEAIMGGTEL